MAIEIMTGRVASVSSSRMSGALAPRTSSRSVIVSL